MRTKLRTLGLRRNSSVNGVWSTTAPAIAVGLALLAGVGGGCESGASKRGLTPEQRAERMPPQHEAFDGLGYRLAWRGFADVLPGETIERFDVLGDVLVTQDTGSVVSVLEPASGVRRWSDQVAGRLTKFLGNVRLGDTLLVSAESELYIFDLPSSSLKAKQKLDLVVNTKPAVVGDVLVYGSISGEILGHNQRTGYRAWGSSLTGAIERDPVMVGDLVGIVSYGGQVIILDGHSGVSTARTSMYDGCDSQPAGAPGVMYCASRDHALYAFGSDGRKLWRVLTDAPITGKPVVQEGAVYCDMPRTGLTALDASTGIQRWHIETVHGEVVSVRGGRLVVWDGKTATLVDPATGDIIESQTLKNVAILKADTFVDGNLYAVSPQGVVGKYQPKQ